MITMLRVELLWTDVNIFEIVGVLKSIEFVIGSRMVPKH